MKKTGLLILLWAVAASAQDASPAADANAPQGTAPTSVSFPIERVQTPTYADMYCAGFISKSLLPERELRRGRPADPEHHQVRDRRHRLPGRRRLHYSAGSIRFSANSKIRTATRFSRDRARCWRRPASLTARSAGSRSLTRAARWRSVRSNTAVIRSIRATSRFRSPRSRRYRFIRRCVSTASSRRPARPAAESCSAKDFDSTLGTGMKVYMNLGANQGVKVGDYFRAVRSYSSDLADPVDSLSFAASTAEDTQRRPPSIEGNWMTKTKGPNIHVGDMPRRAVGEIVDHRRYSDHCHGHDRVLARRRPRRRRGGTRRPAIIS